MTGILNNKLNINSTNLSIFHSLLVSNSQISASYIVYQLNYIVEFHLLFSDIEISAFDRFLATLAATSIPDRPSVVAAFENAEPALFRRLYGDLITYFYSTAEAAERVRTLANKAPREPRPDFDPSLLDTVIAHQPGKRRL